MCAIVDRSPVNPHGPPAEAECTARRCAISAGTGVLTPVGWALVEDLAEGDSLLTRVGRVGRIESLRSVRQTVSRVGFSDGAYAVVGADHEWIVQTHALREAAKRDGRPRWVARATCDIQRLLELGATRSNYVPVVDPVPSLQDRDLPLEPYGLGLLLGDGSFCSGTPSFTKPEPELHAALKELFPRNKQTTIGPADRGAIYLSAVGKRNELTVGLRELGLWGHASYEKFVPNAYKLATPLCRLAILQGLLDTDGWVQRNSSGNTSAYFGTSSAQLAADVVELVESLGGLTTQQHRPAPRYQSGIGRPAFVVRVRLPPGSEPFRLSRKLEGWRAGRTAKATPPVRSIKSVEPVGSRLCYAIGTSGWTDDIVLSRYIVT